MDRRLGPRGETEIVDLNEALVFLGEVRAGISYERLCHGCVHHSEALIELLLYTDRARAFMIERGIPRSYIMEHVPNIFSRLNFNAEGDCYLTFLLSNGAGEETIHRRWIDLMRLYHPDQTELPKSYANECAKHLNEVYAILKDPEKRILCSRSRQEQKRQVAVVPGRPMPEKKRLRVIRPLGDQIFRRRLSKLILPAIVLACLVVLAIVVGQNWDKDPARYNWSPPKGYLTPLSGNDADRQKTTPTTNLDEMPAAYNSDSVTPSKAIPVALPRDRHSEEQRHDGLNPSQGAIVVTTERGKADDPMKAFLDKIVKAYKTGDIEAYIACYSTAAVERGTLKYADIKQAYRQHFARGSYSFSLEDIQVERTSTTYVLTAWYSVSQLTGSDAGSSWRGPVRLILVAENGELKILRNDYDLL